MKTEIRHDARGWFPFATPAEHNRYPTRELAEAALIEFAHFWMDEDLKERAYWRQFEADEAFVRSYGYEPQFVERTAEFAAQAR